MAGVWFRVHHRNLELMFRALPHSNSYSFQNECYLNLWKLNKIITVRRSEDNQRWLLLRTSRVWGAGYSTLRTWVHIPCPYKSLAWPQVPKPSMGRHGQVEPWSSHNSQPSWNTVNSRPCLKGTRWQAIEKNPQDLVSACAHTPTHTCIHAQYMHTQFLKNKKSS